MTELHDNSVCPSADRWLELLGSRDDAQSLARHPELQEHLDGCGACRATSDEVRRYQTLLLRAKAPGLAAEQRQALDERVRMLSWWWLT